MQHRLPQAGLWNIPNRGLTRMVRLSSGSWWSRLNRCELASGEWARWRAARFAVSEGALTVWCRPSSGGGGSVAVWNHRDEGVGIGTVPYVWSRGRP